MIGLIGLLAAGVVLARVGRHLPAARLRPAARGRVADARGVTAWPDPVVGERGRSSAMVGVLVPALRRHRADRDYEQRLAVALEVLARALRAGTPLALSLRHAGEATGGYVGGDLAATADAIDQGIASADALDRWVALRPSSGVRLAAAALVMGTQLGGSRARAVDRVAAGLRQRRAAAREVQAMAGQARLSAAVVISAPAVFAAVSMVSSPALARFLFTTPLGWLCLLGGTVLDVAAAWWMKHIVRSASA